MPLNTKKGRQELPDGLLAKADEGDRTLNIQLGKLTLYH
tara:strand:- start:511 stop:627 length:117 start_codon:yes stop_codon:yes gene_type:complete